MLAIVQGFPVDEKFLDVRKNPFSAASVFALGGNLAAMSSAPVYSFLVNGEKGVSG